MTGGETQPLAWAVLVAYFGLLALLSLYGAHRWYLVWLYARHRRSPIAPTDRFEVLPRLTVQLPLFNELYVARRLIDAVCALDYPRERLEIQVLDDSTDETTALVAELVRERRRAGFDIALLHRDSRVGYKAGALAAGQRVATGDLIAIFDADFVPAPDFARRLVHHFTDPGVGMVQARWGHLNADHSALTRVQSLLLDGHFVIEHTARHRSGRFFNFNGTAGIWRRACIEEAGGWQHDTLTEDLDLSYRAQMKGWRFVYEPEHVTPAELPLEIGSFKTQQHRWAKGSIQTARKLLPAILRSDLSWKVKLEAVAHLTANAGYAAMVALALLVVPSVWLRAEMSPRGLLLIDLPLFAFTTLSVVGFYAVARREARGSLRSLVRHIPFLMAVGIGLSINNCRAVIEAMLGHASEFRRTPKYNLHPGQRLSARKYRAGLHWDTTIEAVLAVHFAIATALAAWEGYWGAFPFLLLFELGYAYVALASVRGLASRRVKPAAGAVDA